MERTTVLQSWECPRFDQSYRTGVSLHSHTSASREQLGFLNGFAGHFPIIPAYLRLAAWQHRRATGEPLDIQRVGWHPPLDARAASCTEAVQIAGLGLRPLVSLTDHDEIAANLALREREGGDEIPISVEWTVPFGATFFHIGVHNLPRRESWNELQNSENLAEALEWLHLQAGVLTVLNHPLWDEGGIGAEAHAAELQALMRGFGRWINAIELNGLRSRTENAGAARLAEQWSKALISGGDRHGAEPNANINLTNAPTFPEFVEEVRRDGKSTVLFLPQYREPLRVRWLQTVWDIVRTYPEADPGLRRWSDRFYYRFEDGAERSIADVWKTAGSPILNQALGMLHFAMIPPMRPALRLLLADRGV